ncbi:substrate-binding domain-containing protein [Pedobacter sp. BS3]|uniref:substrate-binding domain-containing protein n=1 Tax=Pedobacter sp. BS3 TaxID=2567937 RepID=UPI0011EE4582|nr:substrate-binding domain-containing protein [Pedobacter sp. BS3]TZF83787.1 substrate-binding domain-containing protein [Pedobacter sp. BS3]
MQIANFLKRGLSVKQNFLCVLALVLLYGLTACNSKPGDSQNQSGEAAVTSKKDLSHIKVGYCTPSLNASFYVALSKSIQNSVEGYGMKFISVDGQGDITKQITGVEDLIAKGVDVLIINPLDPKALVPSVNAAVKSGLPVFIVDSYIEPSARYITSVLADNQGNGELVGEWIANKLGKTKIKAAIISGAQGNPVGKEKRLGFVRGIAETQLRTLGYTDFSIVSQGWGGWSNNGGLKAMEDILAAHPDINVLMAENDAMAMGAMKAAQEAGKADNMLIVGFDGQKEALELIKQGKYGATALNSPIGLGKLVTESVVKYLNGDKYLDKVIYTPSVLISKEEVNKFYDPKSIF